MLPALDALARGVTHRGCTLERAQSQVSHEGPSACTGWSKRPCPGLPSKTGVASNFLPVPWPIAKHCVAAAVSFPVTRGGGAALMVCGRCLRTLGSRLPLRCSTLSAATAPCQCFWRLTQPCRCAPNQQPGAASLPLSHDACVPARFWKSSKFDRTASSCSPRIPTGLEASGTSRQPKTIVSREMYCLLKSAKG